MYHTESSLPNIAPFVIFRARRSHGRNVPPLRGSQVPLFHTLSRDRAIQSPLWGFRFSSIQGTTVPSSRINLLAHETLEGEEVEDTMRQWLG